MAAKVAVAILVFTSLTACSRAPDHSQLAGLAAAVPSILQAVPRSGSLPESQWPAELARFKPTRVYATPDGLYLVISSSFVQEEGLFVPRSSGFAAQPGTDPEYTLIGQGVFSYRIKG
jgi:hypothetical protein